MIWKSKSKIVFHTLHPSQYGGTDGEAFAFVTIQRFDNEYFKERMTSLSRSNPDVAVAMSKNDPAGIILVDTLKSAGKVVENHHPDLKWKIESVQKKSNTLYADIGLTFSAVTVEKNAVFLCPGGKDNIFVRREAIFLSMRDFGYLIRTSVPSCPKPGPASEWVSKWLRTLRVVER